MASKSNVVEFTGETRLNLPPDRLLDAARGNLKTVIIVGRTHDNEIWYSSSLADIAVTNWEIDLFKQFLLDIALEEE